MRPHNGVIGAPKAVPCNGGIDSARIEQRDGVWVLAVDGWYEAAAPGTHLADSVFVAVSGAAQTPRYFEVLQVPSPRASKKQHLSLDDLSGFSLLTPLDESSGEFKVQVFQRIADQLYACPITAEVKSGARPD